jgi:hypothetical protein
MEIPLSFGRWWSMPLVDGLRVTLPWRVEWAGVVSGFVLNMGGADPIVDNHQWHLTVQCPWALEGNGLMARDTDEDDDPAGVVAGLVGRSVIGIDALSPRGDDPTFVISGGFRLAVSTTSDPPGAVDSYWASVWGATFVYNTVDRAGDHLDANSAGGVNAAS